jgi:hypothetical protein
MAASVNLSENCSSKVVESNGYVCKICIKSVKKGVSCSVCNCWLHERCAKININFLGEDEIWECNTCRENKLCHLLNELKTKDKIIELLRKDILMLKQRSNSSRDCIIEEQCTSK